MKGVSEFRRCPGTRDFQYTRTPCLPGNPSWGPRTGRRRFQERSPCYDRRLSISRPRTKGTAPTDVRILKSKRHLQICVARTNNANINPLTKTWGRRNRRSPFKSAAHCSTDCVAGRVRLLQSAWAYQPPTPSRVPTPLTPGGAPPAPPHPSSSPAG